MKFLSLLLVVGSLAFSPSLSAQGFWDPPGDDPCDIPTNPPCFGTDASAGDAFGGAATEVGRALEERAEEDPVSGFIHWFAHTFGPNIPTEDPPAEDPPAEDPPTEEPPTEEPPTEGPQGGQQSGGNQSNSSSAPATGTWVVTDKEFNANVRGYFNGLKEGQKFQIGAAPIANTKVSYTLTYKREEYQKVRQEYDLTVRISVKRANGRSYTHYIHILAEPGKVYFHSPRRKRKG